MGNQPILVDQMNAITSFVTSFFLDFPKMELRKHPQKIFVWISHGKHKVLLDLWERIKI